MSTSAPQGDQYSVVQNVTATAGFAYGVIGADIHVLGNESPLYVLENYLHPAPLDSRELRQLPSRMLNARYAVVDFTGRESERDDLREWCQNGTRLAVRWLHAPGGQGKTRLAARAAEDLISARWKVVTATHGPGATLRPENRQDMRLDDAPGLLLIVDYADRWPLTDLTWLLSNALLHQPATPTRVLLLARTAYAWPALRNKLGSYHAGVSDQPLQPLPDEAEQREAVFFTARNSFARHYGILNPDEIASPAQLDQPMWGLTLTVHMAALVAVDAHVHDRQPPQDLVGLTAYLLDRERAHWKHLYENRARPGESGLEFQTPPSVMSRAVFTAALTGPVNYSVGKAVLDGVDLELPSDRILTDHTACYPPADLRLATVLEPLYPDRLAEDFLGVTMPGHLVDQPAYPWAHHTATIVLNRNANRVASVFTPRAITFLATAAERWPHLGETFLYPLLRHDPQLAVDAGNAALTALAGLPQMPLDILEAIEGVLPPARHVDLDPGIAVIIRRLTEHRVVATNEPSQHAQLYLDLGRRLSNAGDHRQALHANEEAVKIYRGQTVASAPVSSPDLAKALTNLGMVRLILGWREEALAATEEAVELFRRLQGGDPGAFDAELATSLDSLGVMQSQLGRRDEAVRTAKEAVGFRRGLAVANPAVFEPDLARSLANLGVAQSDLGRWEEALRTTEEAVELFRPLAAVNPATFEPDLAVALGRLGNRRRSLGQREEALAATEEALQLCRRLVAANPATYEPDLAMSLVNLGNDMSYLGRRDEALAATEEAVRLLRRLVADSPSAAEPQLAIALNNLSMDLFRIGQPEEALAATEEAIEIRRRLAAANPTAFEPDLAGSLAALGNYLSALVRREEALAATAEGTELYRRLVAVHPGAFEPYLAASLDNLASDLSETGQWEEALALTRESVELYRRLAESNPGAFESELATALMNLGGRVAVFGRWEDALPSFKEAVELLRRLTVGTPSEFEPPLATALGNLSRAMSELGRREEALIAAGEAVELSRRLAAAHPEAFKPTLANALNHLGECMSNLGRQEEALAATEETVELYRRLAAAHPDAFKPNLAASLDNLGKCMSDLGQREEALAATEEAVEQFRRLAVVRPTTFEVHLAFALCGFAQARAVAQLQLPQAMTAVQEAVEIHRHLAQLSPLPLTEAIHEASDILAKVLEELGRPEQAATVRFEVAGNHPPRAD